MLRAWLIVVMAVVALPQAARAQLLDQVRNPDIAGTGTEPGVTVTSRLRPDYDYKTVRLGSVVLRPEVTSSTGYDDNVLGHAGGAGSLVQETRVNLAATTDWSRDSLSAAVTADDMRFVDQPRQSYTNWSATAGGTYEVGRDTVSVNYIHQNLNQTPRDLNVALIDSSIAYRIDTVQAGYDAVFNRLSVQPGVQIAVFRFDDGTVAGQPYRQGYRNRTVATPNITISYELSPGRSLVGVLRQAIASYRAPDPGQPVRDYNDTAALAGIDLQFGGPWRYRALVGFELRRFSSARFRTIQAPVAELSVIYTPTGLTTVTATLSRQIADSADETTAGLTETSGKLAVDHELKRNILLHGEAGASVVSYGQGGGSQTLYAAGASGTWLLNRNARLALSYDFTARDTRAQGSLGGTAATGGGQQFGGSYIENRYLLRLSLGL